MTDYVCDGGKDATDGRPLGGQHEVIQYHVTGTVVRKESKNFNFRNSWNLTNLSPHFSLRSMSAHVDAAMHSDLVVHERVDIFFLTDNTQFDTTWVAATRIFVNYSLGFGGKRWRCSGESLASMHARVISLTRDTPMSFIVVNISVCSS